MNQYQHFAIMEDAVIRDGLKVPRDQWRLLRKLKVPARFNDSSGEVSLRGIVIDVEATGLAPEKDEVIQLALLPFDYEPGTGRILDVHMDMVFEGLREPSVPISRDATLITGITAAMVAGKTIDAAAVERILAPAKLVIAHNARYDRPMVEKLWPAFAGKHWGCTFESINWLEEGFTAGKLDYLGMQFGWFYDGHRALADCEATLALLAQVLPKSNRRVMSAIRDRAKAEGYLVLARDAPYDAKDKLKDRGYRWRPPDLPGGKVWWIECEDLDAETAWLQAEVYGDARKPEAKVIDARLRYSRRMWS
jgi:DNA polymerase-3 subunit epsilon